MCRHGRNDPACSSYVKPKPPKTPDAENYVIEDVEWIGGNKLVAKVKYPNCKDCAYEGIKILVYLGVTVQQAMRWKYIDPHFRDPKIKGLPTHAPSPAARFPGSAEGWSDAIAWAKGKP